MLVTRIVLGSAVVVAFGVAACGEHFEDCNERLNCTGAGGNAGSSGQGGEAGNGGNGGQGGGPPIECIPSEAMGVVDDSCGVFVSSSKGTAGAAGTKEAPVQTIAEALTLGNGKPIYLCAEAFDEAVVMEAGTDVFGALNCDDDWGYTPGTKSQLNGPANVIAWKITGSGSTTIADVAVTAATATDPGMSSIAMLVGGSTLNLDRCDLTAGDGAPGTAGTNGVDLDDDLDNEGENGASGNTAPVGLCNVQLHTGGMGGPKTCDGVDVAGGNGGSASSEPGSTGLEGLPTNLGPEGNGGLGQSLMAPSSCDSGTQGADGTPGDLGDPGTALGTLTATGYEGAAGTAGSNGGPGQGGGGGGASACIGGNTGPSGGGGGSGGCGGKGATGGAAGGSSIALASVNATVTLTASSLIAGAGGEGGAGGDRQIGGNGGAPGSQAGGACSGANGGPGGNGGSGGGGRGGHSLGIAFTGTEPTQDESMVVPGTEGGGGPGGANNTPAGDGDAGIAAATQSFD
jgi:hypothetical protein